MSQSTMDHYARWERDRDDRQEAARKVEKHDAISRLGKAVAEYDRALNALELEKSADAADQLAKAVADLEQARAVMAADMERVKALMERDPE